MQLQSVFERQRSAFAADPFPEWEVRRKRLLRLRELLSKHEAAIEAAIDADFGGRPPMETQIGELFPSFAEINGALRHGRRWMRPRRAPVSKWFLPASARIVPRPLGVAGIIVPWNYPLYLAVGPLVAALAAGNRAMVKLSEYTPRFADVFAQCCAETFAEEEVAVVTGGADTAAAFSGLPFDHLLFTGSTSVGRKVMGAAANNLTPVTLELGGKSPAVIAPDYPIEQAVTRVLAGKLLNAGQTCIAPDYVLLPRTKIDAFIEAARAQAQRMYPHGLWEADYCSLIHAPQYERLQGMLGEAGASGIRIEPLFSGATQDAAKRRLAPALVIDPPPTLRLMREEIFGPLLPVLGYESIDQALAHINAAPHPLALYWFDHDPERIEHAIKQTRVGGICVNDTLLQIAQESLPFGGVGASGMGHYHGRWGFDTFSKLTPVFRQSRLNAMRLFLPPYRPQLRRLLALMRRY